LIENLMSVAAASGPPVISPKIKAKKVKQLSKVDNEEKR
jgi:hypothetical protein